MRISKITIHNFRSIVDVTFSTYPYLLLVGSNNTGKTAILDCLRAFYEKDKYAYIEDRDFPKMAVADDESWIDITFSLLDEEYTTLPEAYRLGEQKFRVRKFFKTNRLLDNGRTAKGVLLAYRDDGIIEMAQFLSASELQNGRLGNIIYIPAINKVDDYTKLTGPSALRDLVSSIMADVVEGDPAYQLLKDGINTFFGQIKEVASPDGRSLSNFEHELNGDISSWGASFSLNIGAPRTNDIIKNMLDWSVTDTNTAANQGIDSYGSGFQRHFIFSVIKLSSRYIRDVRNNNAGFYPSLDLLLFEEPEAFLHPSQQITLAEDLRSLSSRTAWQVICSTHSPHFVSRSMNDLVSLIHLTKPQTTTIAHQLSDNDLHEITDENAAIMAIAQGWPRVFDPTQEDFCQDMDAIRYFMYFNAERAGVFFSSHVLLVEGPSEVALISKLRDTHELNLANSVYIMDCIGKFNIHRFMNLFGRLGITHSVLYDDDLFREYHNDINRLIDNSGNLFTVHIGQIPNNLEAFLGLPNTPIASKKPQRILYALERGQISQACRQQFCALVQGMMQQ